MPPPGAVIQNIDDAVFSTGYMRGTISGRQEDAINFGALQNVSFDGGLEWADLYGDGALVPLAKGLARKSLTGNFDYGVILPEQFIMIFGGSQTYNSLTNKTSYVNKKTSEPLPFNMHFYSAPNGMTPDMEVICYNCTANGFSLRFGDRAWAMSNGTFSVNGESGDEGKLLEILKKGNLTASS